MGTGDRRFNLLTETIQHHHNVRALVQDKDLLFIVHTADYIINCRLEAPPNDPESMEIHPDAAAFMASALQTIEEWWPEQKVEIDSACQFLLDAPSG